MLHFNVIGLWLASLRQPKFSYYDNLVDVMRQMGVLL